MWNDSPASAVFGQPVDAPEVQRLVPDVELLQAGEAGADHDVALGPGLEGAAATEVQDAVEHVPGLAPHEFQAVVGAIEVLLLRLQLGMFGHPLPFLPTSGVLPPAASGETVQSRTGWRRPGLARRRPAATARGPGRGPRPGGRGPRRSGRAPRRAAGRA